ncbi:MAG TPA: GAF and ANTAR domain-containing protein [Micromonosporaceae bacterium]|nr:GAF and ANTAR domain-containing protein [Micromonosporaceae bacterium]
MDPERLHVVEIVALLRQLTAQLIASDDLDEALIRVANSTVDLIEGPAWCGVMMIRAGGARTAAASDGFPDELDKIQYASSDGPCMTAIRTREMVLCQDISVDDRWPEWFEAARSHGVHGVLAVPVDIDDQVIGSLNLYVGTPNVLTPDVQLVAMLVAEHAGLLVAAVLDRTRQASLNDELTAALADGETINRAIGIVMAQRSCSAEDALQVLRQAATTLRQPLSAVAQRLVDTVTNRSGSVKA